MPLRRLQAYMVPVTFALISTLIEFNPSNAEPISSGNRDEIVSAFSKNLAALNLYSPLEPAGSRGSIGIGLGAGIQATDQTAYDQLHTAELGVTSSNTAIKRSAQKLYFVKGLFSPVDIGITAASLGSSDVKSLGGHLQATVFEGFQLPAISVRISHAQLLGLKSSAMTSNGGDLGISYGFLGHLTLYAGVGKAIHETTVKLSASQDTAYLLNEGESDTSINTELEEQYRYLGLCLRFLPPFVTATIESRTAGNGIDSITGKISIGI